VLRITQAIELREFIAIESDTMPFDSATRGKLQKMVGKCRQILSNEFTSQFQSIYGIQPTGEITDLGSMSHLDDEQHTVASLLRERIDHLTGGRSSDKKAAREAIDRVIREQAFTVLNRLAALRMCEERGIVQECIRGGFQSRGFQVYSTTVGASLGSIYERYRVFLQCVFNEISVDLGILFDRFSPFGLVFPREPALLEVLELLNDGELKEIWKDDETIGWVYQYINSKEEREAMRKASAAPRNSRELAVRNQFFTPRYVVEFLTDNTLGRIWYEMRQGVTALKEQCGYLVKRSDEVFLAAPFSDLKSLKDTIHYPMHWLVEGTEDSFPAFDSSEESTQHLIDLAHCVNGYARHPFEAIVDETWWPFWVKDQLEQGRPLTDFSTQELLDTLFGIVRADRHSSPYSTLLEEPSTLSIANEIRRRAIQSRKEELSQEELLKQPVFVPLREKKDPRDLKILDPACGSGHFLLYAFDLLEAIYLEAWADDHSPKSEITGKSIREDFPDQEILKKEVPGLIIAHNLHGIDIDPRAVQIAGLSLWLRAQRSYEEQGLKPADRPPITRANVVCAEPMPGEPDLLEEFISSFRGERRLVGELVREVWEKMQLADEAGSLLRIEEELRDAIGKLHGKWEEAQRLVPSGQLHLWRKEEPKQLEIRSALRQVTRKDFWEEAEDAVLAALEQFVDKASNGKGYQRRLFAEDAERGFAFIDLCRKRFDVVLMNPPFGSLPKKNKLDVYLPAMSAGNLYAAFLIRAREMLCGCGCIGCITDRTFLLLPTYQEYRDLLRRMGSITLADLGWEVLDGAQVATAAYIVHSNSMSNAWFVDSRNTSDKEAVIRQACAMGERAVFIPSYVFESIPTHPIAHWAPPSLRNAFNLHSCFEPAFGIVRKGLSPGDSDRFVKLWWEIPPADYGLGRRWAPYANGGEFSPFYRATKEVVEWGSDGKVIRAYTFPDGRPRYVIRSADLYGKAGLTFGKRGEVLNVQILPAGQVISNEGYLILPQGAQRDTWVFLAFFNSVIARYLVNMVCGLHKEVGAIKVTPVAAELLLNKGTDLALRSELIYNACREIGNEETNPEYIPVAFGKLSTLEALFDFNSVRLRDLVSHVVACEQAINHDIAASFMIEKSELDKICSDESALTKSVELGPIAGAIDLVGPMISWLLGASFGRWDVRIAFNPSLAPKLPHPFSPLPVSPPGMLVGQDGLPAEPGGIVSEEWLRARPDANTLPPDGSVKTPTIPDSEYPLRISWDGVLVDDVDSDEGQSHQEDIIRRIREVFDLLWGERSHAIEQEACEILRVSSLREYFRKPAGFFEDHLKRYSKSRRKAPIYWPLSTESGSYTLWVYYHRLTDQTLYQCVMDFVNPKLEGVSQDVERLRGEVLKGGPARQRDQLERLQKLQEELTDFRGELLRVAGLPNKPNLNDGVLITASPLFKLFRLPKWRKDLEECWRKLESGEYDWAHLAYSIWPDRVRETCRKDKSIAIAHGLEDLYEEPEVTKKPKRGRKRT